MRNIIKLIILFSLSVLQLRLPYFYGDSDFFRNEVFGIIEFYSQRPGNEVSLWFLCDMCVADRKLAYDGPAKEGFCARR
jgi:hypothetical protein